MLLFFCQILWHTTEVGCYTGTALSAVLAWRLFRHIWKRWLIFDFSFSIVKHQQTCLACLFRMETLTWINKMFLFYFCMDSVFGTIDTYFLFKLFRERWLVDSRYLPSPSNTPFSSLADTDPSAQFSNCLYFICTFHIWSFNRHIFQLVMVFSRSGLSISFIYLDSVLYLVCSFSLGLHMFDMLLDWWKKEWSYFTSLLLFSSLCFV